MTFRLTFAALCPWILEQFLIIVDCAADDPSSEEGSAKVHETAEGVPSDGIAAERSTPILTPPSAAPLPVRTQELSAMKGTQHRTKLPSSTNSRPSKFFPS